jgi:hypothetical protein
MVKCLYRLLIVGCCFLNECTFAQHDTTYYSSFGSMLTGRFYFSKKYTSFQYVNTKENIRLDYLPNTTLNMGVGATYRSISLNLAYGFDFLNPEKGEGKTKYLDLQWHFYGRKFLIDLLSQFYSGFYLTNKELRDAAGNYYSRPDIQVQEFGWNLQYIVNHDRFSYRAGFLQNEWQKKSAGSMVLGWQFLFGNGASDSTIVPSPLRQNPPEATANRLSFIETGPMAGYAYTLVIKKHFFIMASATVTLDFGISEVQSLGRTNERYFLPNFGLKAFAGYNSSKNAISLTFVNETVNVAAGKKDQLFGISTGNLRLNFIHRFKFHSKLLQSDIFN